MSTAEAPPRPPQYGFVIDQRRCIGCHACTVACKAENEVPVGSFRTWVKYTEAGTFPTVKRHFSVLRCNHCDSAPCVEICPVNALHKRPDAIVDLDRDLCIGCKACMQACPYDALYLNEDDGVAEKCHYCAHRTEVGLEPACVIVCPVEAIVSGDVSDPASRIAKLIAEEPTSRRRLEKGTRPRLWYIDAFEDALVPGRAAEPSTYLWSERHPQDFAAPPVPGAETVPHVTTTLDVAHPPVWGAHVWAYLVTKNVSAGVALVAPALAALGVAPGWWRDLLPEAVALLFLGITGVLLTHDLGKPFRAWRIMLAPNTRSWLVKGAWVLTAFGGVTAAALVARLLGHAQLADALRLVNLPCAALTSGYTAFLLAQCRGRDLWLERGLFAQLILRALALGAAFAALLPRAAGAAPDALRAFGVSLILLAGATLASLHHAPTELLARRAHALMVSRLAGLRNPALLLGFAGLGACGAALLALLGAGLALTAGTAACAAALLVVAQFLHEQAFIEAGQAVPNS